MGAIIIIWMMRNFITNRLFSGLFNLRWNHSLKEIKMMRTRMKDMGALTIIWMMRNFMMHRFYTIQQGSSIILAHVSL